MGTKARVLIADDEELLRTSVRMILELYGYDVSVAVNATEAIEKIAHEPFDILLSDLRMPRPGDGFRVVEAMQRASPECITILMSANLALESEPTIHPKPTHILRKPLEIPSFINLIRDSLSQQSPALSGSSLEMTET